MLRNKDIKKISELKKGFTHGWLEPDFIISSLNVLCEALHKLFKEASQLL